MIKAMARMMSVKQLLIILLLALQPAALVHAGGLARAWPGWPFGGSAVGSTERHNASADECCCCASIACGCNACPHRSDLPGPMPMVPGPERTPINEQLPQVIDPIAPLDAAVPRQTTHSLPDGRGPPMRGVGHRLSLLCVRLI